VTFFGLPAGEVTGVGLALDSAKGNIRPRVTIAFYPERLVAYTNTKSEARDFAATIQDEAKRRAFLRRLIEERGLRAQLKSGSLLTGQLYVAFDYYPKAAKVKIDFNQEEPELPVVAGTLVELEAKLGSILEKIDKMPLEAIGNDIRKDLESLDQTLQSAKKLVTEADAKLVPQLKTDLDDLHRTLNAFELAITNVNATVLGPDAPAQQELRSALQDFARAARSLRTSSKSRNCSASSGLTFSRTMSAPCKRISAAEISRMPIAAASAKTSGR
jgi:paraquat-inducible protein B